MKRDSTNVSPHVYLRRQKFYPFFINLPIAFPNSQLRRQLWRQHLLGKLQKFQNRAARIIAGLIYEINSADVLESLGWETLESRRQRMKSVFLYTILIDYTSPNLKRSLVGSNSNDTDSS